MNANEANDHGGRRLERAKQLLFWLLVAAFAWLLGNHLAELEQLGQTLRQGRWSWVLAALLLQLAYAVVFSLLYAVAFAVVEIKSRVVSLLPLVFASLFVGATTPMGGAAGVALFVDDATRQGEPLGKATAAVLLAQVSHLGVFCLILGAGLLELLLSQRLVAFELAMGGVMLVYAGALAGALALGFYRPGWLWRTLHRLQRAVNHVGGWFGQPALLEDEWAARHSDDFATAAREMRHSPTGLLQAILLALLAHMISLITLAALFKAFRVQPSLGLVVAGYTLTILFTIISPTPYGVGIVEVLLPAVYTSLGLPPAEAALITFAFRGATFWLPFFLGFLLLRWLHLFRPATPAEGPPPIWPAAVLTGLMGLLNIISVLAPSLALRVAPLQRYSPLSMENSSNLMALVAGLALLTLAYGLAQRHRYAWWLVQAALLVSATSHFLRSGRYAEGLVAVLLVAYLIWQRSQFQ